MSTLEAIAVIVGVVSGVSGLVLGILNYWEQRVSTRPRIVVRLFAPFIRHPETPQREKMPGQVILHNVGHVAVVMSPYLWFPPKHGKRGGYGVNLDPCGDRDPTNELKPQRSGTLWFSMDALPEGRKLGRPYIQSEVGEHFKPSRYEMRKFARGIRELAKQRKQAST